MPDYIQTGLAYGGPQGGSYGSPGGGTYGPLERGSRVDLFEPGEISRTISTDAIISVDIGLEHSALSDMSIDLPPFAELTSQRFADGEMRYHSDGDLIFSAVIDEVNFGSDYTVTLTGPATEDAPLDEGEIDIAFEDTLTADAIQYVCNEYTPHAITVHPAPEVPLDDVAGQSARAKGGFESILTAGSRANNQDDIKPIRDFPDSLDQYLWRDSIPTIHDTSPFVITNDGLTQHQSCVVQETEDGSISGDSSAVVSHSDASAGEAVKLLNPGDAMEFSFKLQYNVPAGAFVVALRSKWGTLGSSEPYDRLKLDIDGSTFATLKTSQVIRNTGGYSWWDFGGHYTDTIDARGPDDDPHTVRIEKVDGDDELFFDLCAFVDNRYQHGFDYQEEVDSNNALTGPYLYPLSNPVVFDALSPGADIDSVTLQYDFDEPATLGYGGITVPATGDTKTGGTLVDSEEVFVELNYSAQDTVVPDVYGMVLLGNYDDPDRTTTPTQGTEVQILERFGLSYSGTALSIIDSQQYQGSPLSILQDLHDYSNRRFTIEHGVESDTSRIESFTTADSRQRRDESDHWTVTDVSRDTSIDEYANVVHVEGAAFTASQHYRATASDEAEIQALAEETGGDGVRAITIEDTSLTSDNDCRSKARSELRERTRQDTVGGSVDTTPQLPTPGKPYLAEFFGGADIGGYGYDYGLSYGAGGMTYSSLESVSYTESAGSASTSLDFERVQGLYRALEQFGPDPTARARTSQTEAQPAAISVGTISEDDDDGDDDSDDDSTAPIAYLDSEDPLSDAAYVTGGSAGDGTHGGHDVSRPSDMPTRAESNYQVSSASGLRSALDSAGSGDVIYIDGDIPIDSFDNYLLPGGVTLVGGFCDPNIPGRGPVLHSSSYNRRHFEAQGDLTLWGISMEGPREDYFDPREESGDKTDYYTAGIFARGDTFDATGCEWRGWTIAGLELGADGYQTQATIDRCTFVNNPMETYGYGIEQYDGHMDIGRCYFNYNRHSISGYGYNTESYYLYDSMHGPDAISHAFDMHGLRQNDDSYDGDTAGKYVHIENVTFPTTSDSRPGYSGDQEMCAIRGVSTETTWIRDCHTYHDSAPTGSGGEGSAWRQETVDSFTNFTFSSNNFGERLQSGDGCPLNTEVQ